MSTQTNEELFIQAYQASFPKVASFVRKMGGTPEEAKDIFQDALVIYYEKTSAAERHIPANGHRYLEGIARHLWYRKFREKKNLRSLETLQEINAAEDEPKVSPRLLSFIEHSGKKCLELLKSFYYDKLNMKEISEKFGFSGERSAASQKFKCLEKVRDTMKERSLTKEDFYA